jgi:hypothetical protein
LSLSAVVVVAQRVLAVVAVSYPVGLVAAARLGIKTTSLLCPATLTPL